MNDLRGHVDRFDRMLAAGWAISESDPQAAPEVEIVQNGRSMICLKPAFDAPTLRSKLDLPPYEGRPVYVWRLWLPLSAGILPDCPAVIRFRSTEKPLQQGAARVIPLADAIDQEVLADFATAVVATTIVARKVGGLSVHFQVSAPPGFEPWVRVGGRVIAAKRTGESTLLGQPRTNWSVAVDVGHAEILTAGNSLPVMLSSPDGDMRQAFHASLRGLHLPRTIFDESLRIAPIPETENITRVVREVSDIPTKFLAGGATTFRQIQAIVERFGGTPLSAATRIVDWGVGCARVARCFWEVAGEPPAGEIVGLDIDEVNIDWCRRHMSGHGRYDLLSLKGFELDASSVDLLYGISVMTHLSERHQFLWLEEIRRVLKPGGLAILTTHGEYSTYRSPSLPAVPFVAKFGFFDGMPDGAIGAERDDYYRATFQSRGYVRKNWGDLLEVLDVLPAVNGLAQDFVALRKS